MMGQDGEEAAELLATMRGDHIAMKTWYNSCTDDDAVLSNLKERYGSTYPEFWKDVIHWEGWKETRKAYLTYTEKGRQQQQSSSSSSQAATRKRRSRWETDTSTTNNDETTTTKRKSRWERADNVSSGGTTENNNSNNIDAALAAAMNVVAAGSIKSGASTSQQEASKGVLEILPGLPAGLTEEQQVELAQLQQRLRVANERLTNLEVEAARVDALPRGHPDRSPSPPPVYGADGKRRNTRAVRWRERYTNERAECLEKMMDINPALRPPGFIRRKRTKKIYIPVDEHPTYNFIGLIIGPRGKTQKEMELSTNCKIAIRGKGSIKEGARGRRDGKVLEGDDEPLHVVVTGDEQENVERAAKMIEDMLIVIDDDKNIHKQQQLRELALLNGTLKEDDYCTTCAEKGHRHFECPKRFAFTKSTVQVKCAICGDSSHPTRDCTQQQANAAPKDQNQMDSDYLSFMAELDGKPKVDNEISTNITTTHDAAAQNSQQPTASAQGQQQQILPPTMGETAAVVSTSVVVPSMTQQLPSTNGTTTANIPPPATTTTSNVVIPPFGFLPSGLPPPPITSLPPPPPPPPPSMLPGATVLPPPLPMTSSTVPPPSFAIPPPPPMMGGYSSAAPQMMMPPSYGAPAVGYYDPSSFMATADGSKHQQADNRTMKGGGKKNKKKGGVDELEGWDPSMYYNQVGNDATGAVGFNWWEQT